MKTNDELNFLIGFAKHMLTVEDSTNSNKAQFLGIKTSVLDRISEHDYLNKYSYDEIVNDMNSFFYKSSQMRKIMKNIGNKLTRELNN